MANLISIYDRYGNLLQGLQGTVVGPVSDYQTTQDATPLAPGDTFGGTPQATLTGISQKFHDLVIGLGMSTDHIRGVVEAEDFNPASHVSQYTINTPLTRFNSDNLLIAAVYGVEYLDDVTFAANAAAGVMINIGGEVSQYAIAPRFLGNPWDYLKQFTSAYGVLLRAVNNGVADAGVGVFYAGRYRLVLPNGFTPEMSIRYNVNRNQRAKQVAIHNYNLRSATSQVFFKATETYSLALGETQEIVVPSLGTPDALNQPVCVSGISPFPYTSGAGQYVVTGSDGYIMAPALWTNNGGKITAALSTESADEIVLTITAPSGPEVQSRAPFTISEGADRPALYVTGNGVLVTDEVVTIFTGDADSPQTEVEIDNKLIGTYRQALDRGVHTAAQYCGPQLSATITGQPKLSLIRNSYTSYGLGSNLLCEETASCSRLTGAIQGWSFGTGMTPLPSATGISLTGTGTANGQIAWTTPPSRDSVEEMAWTKRDAVALPVTPGSTYGVLTRYTRRSGTNTLRIGIEWFNSAGASLGTSYAAAGAVTTNVSTTTSHTAVAPASTAFARVSLLSGAAGAVDLLIQQIQMRSAGSVAEIVPAVIAEAIVDNGYYVDARIRLHDAMYRVTSITYGPKTNSLKLDGCTTMGDVDAEWAGKTYGQKDAVLSGWTYSQIQTRPLATSL